MVRLLVRSRGGSDLHWLVVRFRGERLAPTGGRSLSKDSALLLQRKRTHSPLPRSAGCPPRPVSATCQLVWPRETPHPVGRGAHESSCSPLTGGGPGTVTARSSAGERTLGERRSAVRAGCWPLGWGGTPRAVGTHQGLRSAPRHSLESPVVLSGPTPATPWALGQRALAGRLRGRGAGRGVQSWAGRPAGEPSLPPSSTLQAEKAPVPGAGGWKTQSGEGLGQQLCRSSPGGTLTSPSAPEQHGVTAGSGPKSQQ